jgi:cell division protein FtsA
MNVVPLHGRKVDRGAAPEKGGIVAALDIGSSKIACLIAQVLPPKSRGDDKPSLRYLGVGHQASRGVKAGTIVDIDAAERSIRLAVDTAERMAQTTISEIVVGMTGGRPRSALLRGTAHIKSGEVSQSDIDAAILAAIRDAEIGRRRLLHVAPARFTLDGNHTTAPPAGLFGEELVVEVNVVTAEGAALRNLALAIERCHLAIADHIVAPNAAAQAVLADDEKELGVTLIDMGGATTGIAVFAAGRLVFADVIPIGGHHITNDLAHGLSTTVAHAERMKTLWGSALASGIDERETIAVPLLGERGVDTVHNVPKSLLTGIIRPRLEEVFEMVATRLSASPAAQLAGKRAVLTGGASQLTGAREVAAQWLGMQVRIGAPIPVATLPDAAQMPNFSVAVGLLNCALRPERRFALPDRVRRSVAPGERTYLRRVGRWIAESF